MLRIDAAIRLEDREVRSLIEARRNGALIATYAYDAFEQRVAKTTTAAAPGGASSVHFIHDQFGRLIAEPADWPYSTYREWKKEYGGPINNPPEDWKPVRLGER